MEWLLLAAAAGLVVGLAIARARGPGRAPAQPARSSPRPDPAATATLSAQDLADVRARFAAVLGEDARSRDVLVGARLEVLVRRRVPLRLLRPAPGEHVARLVFADGTVLLARAAEPGEIYRVAMHVEKHHVCLQAWAPHPDGQALRLAWDPRGHADLVALGLDQAD